MFSRLLTVSGPQRGDERDRAITRQAMLIASLVPPLISPARARSPLVRATKIVATVSPRLLLDLAAGFCCRPCAS